ncbi:PRTRC system protein B [Flavobacterium sp.]|uniref:PRTRC system protein B n=1 Tax=Flavobacterium sp. TaxID=239 RepID=UPI003A8CE69C
MDDTKDITRDFGVLYHPVSALVVYQTKGMDKETYVEHFDMDRNGNPVNAHPLTVREANHLVKALQTKAEKGQTFLKSKGILPATILHIDPSEKGSVLWYTKAQSRPLYFTQSLGITNGRASVPPMLWHATKNSLSVYALATGRRPTESTPLYHAPFFNIYENGNVCMGTVTVDIKNVASVQDFTRAWETYFFKSYFSHLMGNHNPVKGNCVSLWKKLIGTNEPFPKGMLKKNDRTLKNLL